MVSQLLIENFSPAQAQLTESHDVQKNLYLTGRMMAAEAKNLNNRIYPLAEITKAVVAINARINEGSFPGGELGHPENLTINLSNICHIITEAWMDGNNAVGKCKVLNTPSGQIVQALVDGGFKLGVSSRGTGNVNHEGIVESFEFVALDAVSQPSGPGCYPDAIREAVEHKKILTLAEAVVHDPKAQKYFKAEIKKFMASLTGK